MILLKETAGDTLSGAIDGVNAQFGTTFDFQAESVNVYFNGRLLIRAWDDGFWVTGTRLVTMKEAPMLGDTLEIEYRSDTRTGGGALGGIPQAATMEVLRPNAEATKESIPDVIASELVPISTSRENTPETSSSGELRPMLIRDGG